MDKESIFQEFATPEQAAAEEARKQADATKPKIKTPSAAGLWAALKSKGLLDDSDMP